MDSARALTLRSNSWEGWDLASRVLLILWVALLAVDRIDFLGGEGEFRKKNSIFSETEKPTSVNT